MKKRLLFVLFALSFTGALFAQSDYKYEPIFTYNFTKYIKWPEAGTGDFVIGVSGDKKAVDKFQAFFNKRLKGTQQIVVRQVYSISDVADCDILFMTKKSKIALKDASQLAVEKSILLVTENPGNLKLGSIINIIVVDGKMKFELNQELAKKARLQISGELRRLAILS